MKQMIVNAEEWIEKSLGDLPPGMTPGEREAVAFLSMALTKMYLIGETSHEWSEPFRRLASEAAKDLVTMLGENPLK